MHFFILNLFIYFPLYSFGLILKSVSPNLDLLFAYLIVLFFFLLKEVSAVSSQFCSLFTVFGKKKKREVHAFNV